MRVIHEQPIIRNSTTVDQKLECVGEQHDASQSGELTLDMVYNICI